MLSETRPIEQRYMQRLLRLATGRPWLTVCVAIALAGVALGYTQHALEFETSRNALVSSHARYLHLYDAFKQAFRNFDYIVVAIEAPHPERGKEFVNALVPRLQADTQHFARVIGKLDTTRLEGKKLLFLSPEELLTLEQRLEDAQDLMFDLSETPGLVQLLTSINQEISRAMVSHLTSGFLGSAESTDSPSSGAQPSLDVSFLTALFTEMEQAVAEPNTYRFRSPWATFFLEDGGVFSEEGYLTANHDRFFFVLVGDRPTPGSFVKHAAPLRALRAHLAALGPDFPDIEAGVTGGQALANDEMVTAQRDTLLATAIALMGVALLFIVSFRQVRQPLLVVATLVIAICWSLGLTTLTVGHLNILSVAFMPILVGLGIDYGIHLLARYGEERAHNEGFDVAIQAAYLHTGPGVIVAALTTALAFYAVMLTDFRGLIEVGFIAGSGIVLCLIASFTLLPALLALSERHPPRRPAVWRTLEPDPLRILMRFPRAILGLIVTLTLIGAWLLPWPRFDYNLLNLQARGTESVEWEHRLLAESDHSSWYAVSSVDSIEALHQRKAQFEALATVDRVTSIASVIPKDQMERLPLVKNVAPWVEGVIIPGDELEPADRSDVETLLKKIRFKLQRDTSDWDPAKRPSEAQLTAARHRLIALQTRLQPLSDEAAQRALEGFQQPLMADFADKLALLQRNVNPTPVVLDDVPPYLQQRYVSPQGHYALQVFSRENIWDREPMQRFVDDLRTVDANSTGDPVVAFHSIQQIQQGYARGGLYALLAIVGIIILIFRRLRSVFLAVIPTLFGGLWTIACMTLLDLQFNMANLIILPLFIGIAVDDGIHLVHRIREDPEAATGPLTRSTGQAIVLTSLTSMVGFGSLLVARHQGVFSLGLLTMIGVGCSLVATLVVIPLVSHLLPLRTPPEKARPRSPV